METLYLFDASGYLYRSYFAIQPMNNRQGESTHALYGFIRSLQKVLVQHSPPLLAAVFDGPNNAESRKQLYSDYKEHRKETPPDLIPQIARAQQWCELMGIPCLALPGVEADDTIGSIATWASGWATVKVYSSDKDLAQIVSQSVFLVNPVKEAPPMGREGVKQQYGVYPEQMVDFLSITGDASDNVPGIRGMGPKTAAALLGQYQSLEGILSHLDEIGGKKEAMLREGRETLLLSRQLVTLNLLLPIPQQREFFQRRAINEDALNDFYADMNFASLTRERSARPQNTVRHDFRWVQQEADFQRLCQRLERSSRVAVEPLFSEKEHPARGEWICCYVGIEDSDPSSVEVFGISRGVWEQHRWANRLASLLTRKDTTWVGHDLKRFLHLCLALTLPMPTSLFDAMIASYVLNAHEKNHSLEHLVFEFDRCKRKSLHECEKTDGPVERWSEGLLAAWGATRISDLVRLAPALQQQLKERSLLDLAEHIEFPLISVLTQMERTGIFIDLGQLQELGGVLEKELAESAARIYQQAGQRFNLNSPKQLSVVLFEKMGIVPPKKTATGFSTNAEVLEELQEQYPIARDLLTYRSLEKLRSTYVDALPRSVDPTTRRIHPSFQQSVTATGRLSCQSPNLQNIPVRTALGKKIRAAFVPQQEGWSYLSADYSQIELRLLAHLSQDSALLRAFRDNEDIHTFTAAQIFNLPIEEVSERQRYQAKAVNFGIMYGQQAYGLSQVLGIDQKQAADFIDRYLARYSGVKKFFEDCKNRARETGRAVTLFGRERLLPEIHSKNFSLRALADRLAVNTPLQGTQADLIKKAMIAIQKQLAQEAQHAWLILQIHDELIFEVEDGWVDRLGKMVQETMSTVLELDVPLVVDIHVGKNWAEC